MDQITGSQQEQKSSMGEVWLFDDWTGAKDDSHPTMYRTVPNKKTVPQVTNIPPELLVKGKSVSYC